MIDKEALLKKLQECEDEFKAKNQYWHDHGDNDEFYYYQGYDEGADDVILLIRRWLND